MRIIAGKYKNTPIITETSRIKLDVRKIRPTTEKLRAAVFNILPNFFDESHNEVLNGKKVLDVCCGVGSFGLECLSRGAATVSFLDNQRNHLEIVKLNLEKMKCLDQAKIVFGDAQNFKEYGEQYDLIYIDPPYKPLSINKIMANDSFKSCLKENTIIITESSAKLLPERANNDFLLLDQRNYGSSVISFYKLKSL